jgi:hypothetical protein
MVFRRHYFTSRATLDRSLHRFMQFTTSSDRIMALSRQGAHPGNYISRSHGGSSLSSCTTLPR